MKLIKSCLIAVRSTDHNFEIPYYRKHGANIVVANQEDDIL